MSPTGLYARVADLPLAVESYRYEALAHEAPGFTRVSTVVHLEGGGHEGVGEDVTYEAQEQLALHHAGPVHALAGRHTLDGFSRLLDGLDLFPEPPAWAPSRHYRRWAFESAALDLALRQAGAPLHGVLERPLRPVRFVVSMGLGDPPTTDRVRGWLARDPALRFKLDPTSGWDQRLVDELAATGAVATVDLKGAYSGTPVDGVADPAMYERVVRAFPEAWIEDPKLTPETRAVLAGQEDRITWDAPIHSAEDIAAREHPPRTVNMKPSRFGSVRALLDAYDHMAERGIGAYGGGQWELGPGRGQIQYLAAMFHPDAPNDVAPRGYNEQPPPRDLPSSPLEPRPAPTGFRREA